MNIQFTFIASCVFLLGAIPFAMIRKKKKLHVLIPCVFLAIFLLTMPIVLYSGQPDASGTLTVPQDSNWFKDFMRGVLGTMQVFGMEGSYPDHIDQLFKTQPYGLKQFYISTLASLYVVAPLLTLGVVLSFFKNLTSYLKWRWVCLCRRHVHVFSCVNDRTVTLAESIQRKGNRFVFLCQSSDAYEARLSRLKAIIMYRDIANLSASMLKKPKTLSVYLAGDDEQLNLTDTVKLMTMLQACRRNTEKVNLYTFSIRKEAELIINSINQQIDANRQNNRGQSIHVRRINEARAYIYKLMEDNHLFIDKRKSKLTVMIAGCGWYGEEMMRALVWGCCCTDCALDIHVFDQASDMLDRLKTKYPELFTPPYDANLRDEYQNYSITVHSGLNILESDTVSQISQILPDIIFVSVGSDRDNLEAAIHMREVASSIGMTPRILTDYTELSDAPRSKKHSGMEESGSKMVLKNHRGQSYDIETVSRMQLYSYQCLIKPPIEHLAFRFHVYYSCTQLHDIVTGHWDCEDIIQRIPEYAVKMPGELTRTFYDYEYNYRSSMAQALYWSVHERMGDSIDNQDENRALEHMRWIAYMRSEGYQYGAVKNWIGKRHPDLKPYSTLDSSTQSYDGSPLVVMSAYRKYKEEKMRQEQELYS